MKPRIYLLLASLALAAVLAAVPSPLVSCILGFVLLWVLPGLAWSTVVLRGTLDRVERWVIGLGLSFVIVPIATLLLAYLPGPLTRVQLLCTVTGLTGLPLLWPTRRHASEKSAALATGDELVLTSPSRRRWLWRNGGAWLLAALLIGSVLRLANLNYSQFQGDEATVMVRAARVLEGDSQILFQHTKGPAELAVVMATWRLAGATNEWMARLPFTWAGMLGLVGVFLCGQRSGYPQAGGIAALLLAVNGYFVAFARIVQYQSLVFALSTLGLLCLLIYHSRGHGRLVSVGALLFAGGFLGHYDAALALPAGLFLIASRLAAERRRFGRALLPVLGGGLVGAVSIGTFYVPFLLSPYVAFTFSYLSGRMGSSQHGYNNLGSLFNLSAVYNPVVLLAGTTLALAAYVALAWSKWGRVAAVASVLLFTALLTGLLWPELWQAGQQDWAWVPAVLLAVGTLLAPGMTARTRALWIWFSVPATLYLFFVARPWTHIHTAFPAWSVLSGVGVLVIGQWLARRSGPAMRAASALGAAVLVLSTTYASMVFVDHTPEYQRTFPQSRRPLFWTPYDRMPTIGLFGFPYQAGWNVIGDMIDRGELTGSYNSNEEPAITDYYTRQALRLGHGEIDAYILAEDVQDEVNIHWEQVRTGYQPALIVTVSGQPKLTLYQRSGGSPLTIAAERYSRPFAPSVTPDQVSRPAFQEPPEIRLEDYTPHRAVLGGSVQLLGYRIDTGRAVPGGYVEVTLLWQGLEPMSVDYHVFNHLYDGDSMRGQLDGQPMSGTYPTSRWEPGGLVADTYRIPIDERTPPGPVPLLVGMYDYWTMQRLSVLDENGAAVSDSIHLGDVVVRP